MTIVLVVLTFVALVALDHYVLSKRYREADWMQPVKPAPQPLAAAHQPVPVGVFVQPTMTWGRIGQAGEVYLGVHPMLLGLVGAGRKLEFRASGEHVAKGEPLVSISRSGRRLTLRSPISGRVDRVNLGAVGETQWTGAEGRGGDWLCRLLPEFVTDESRSWLSGTAAAEWTRQRYDELRAYLTNAVADGHLGVTMADGGELPAGILGELDQGVWDGLEDCFLAPEGTTREPRT
jgi:glycine cleavage system H lipoate-binding protein